jgi:hypothetical protein
MFWTSFNSWANFDLEKRSKGDQKKEKKKKEKKKTHNVVQKHSDYEGTK